MIGKTLGHYQITNQLGRGGMGEVYLAEDVSSDGKVALKLLPNVFMADFKRIARFEHEAKVLASLNHPNIAAIHGLKQAEGKRFLVLDLVEGETLAQRLSKGPLPLEEALGVCCQMAEALEAAHEKGVIHGDLKPANVMIAAGGKVKILDFGLAKALSVPQGVILGTAEYMSPERARGKSIGRRADIWAFGCILYECLTGKRAFEGKTVTETLGLILKDEPDWQALPATTPPSIRLILRQCWEKNLIADHSWRSVFEMHRIWSNPVRMCKIRKRCAIVLCQYLGKTPKADHSWRSIYAINKVGGEPERIYRMLKKCAIVPRQYLRKSLKADYPGRSIYAINKVWGALARMYGMPKKCAIVLPQYLRKNLKADHSWRSIFALHSVWDVCERIYRIPKKYAIVLRQYLGKNLKANHLWRSILHVAAAKIQSKGKPEPIVDAAITESRIFVNCSVEDITGNYRNRTANYGNKLFELYKGKWIDLGVTIGTIDKLLGEMLITAHHSEGGSLLILRFDSSWEDPVSHLHIGDDIRILGRLDSATLGILSLSNCELGT